MIDQDLLAVLVVEYDSDDVSDVRDATPEEREHFFAGSPERAWFGVAPDLPFQGWAYVDEFYGPRMETVGYVVSRRG